MNAKVTPTNTVRLTQAGRLPQAKGATSATSVAALSPAQQCMSSAAASPGVRRRERLHVWEMPSMFHCSVLGTCLSLSELQSIARRARHGTLPGATAYEVHVHFVKALATCNSLSKLVDKALEKRYSLVARTLRRAQSERELEVLWKETLDHGDVAGAYWAAMSHPLATETLHWRLFGEVHMLSHLLGASRQSDLCRLHKLELTCTELDGQLGLVKQQQRAVRKQRDKFAQDLTDKQLEAERLARRLVLAEARVAAVRAVDGVGTLEAQVAELQAELDRSRERADLADARSAETCRWLEQARAAAAAASDRQQQLLEENEALEAELRENVRGVLEASEVASEAVEPQRLEGRRILYVGGRSHLVPYYRVIVERRGAEFLHHDGGLEASLDALTRGLSTVDAVVCPMDCVSHAACSKVKQACKRLGKQFIPLRSSGLSSFARGIQSVA